MVGGVIWNAAAISPAGRSRSQIRPRISRRIGDDSAEMTRWTVLMRLRPLALDRPCDLAQQSAPPDLRLAHAGLRVVGLAV